jgi:hypothetical protein
VFHFLIQDISLLERFHYSFMKHVQSFQDEDEKNEKLQLYLLLLYPNNNGESPFHIGIKMSSQFVDVMMQMLAQIRTAYYLSRFVFQEAGSFGKLMDLNISSFTAFMEKCFYQTISMEKVQQRAWLHGDDDEFIMAVPTSLMTEAMCKRKIGELQDGEFGDEQELTYAERQVSMLQTSQAN